jgi:hypothetical protein
MRGLEGGSILRGEVGWMSGAEGIVVAMSRDRLVWCLTGWFVLD